MKSSLKVVGERTDPCLIVIAGPTGSGKSHLALALAKLFGGEIINCDSVQVYRGLDIGSAKTPPEERAGVAHHLLDIVDPTAELTAGVYAQLARAALQHVASRSALPILVGGTGFYLRSLLDGLSPAPVRNPELRQRLNQLALRRPGALHRFLRQRDAVAANRIHPNDHQKLIRAVELAGSAPPPPREPLTGFRILKIALNPSRADLHDRINRRSERMFEAGLLDETEALLSSGVPAQAKSLQSLGYKQAVAVLENCLTRAEAIDELQTKTRQYAKRQMTWFRRELNIHWLPGFGEEPEIAAAAYALIERNGS